MLLPADVCLVERLLREALGQVSQELGLTHEHVECLQGRCDTVVATVAAQSMAACPAERASGEVKPGAELDDNAVRLFAQVREASARLTACKARAPMAVKAAAETSMAQLRPSLPPVVDIPQLPVPTPVDGLAAAAAAGVGAQGPDVQALRSQLVHAVDQFPGLRVQLEQAVHRLENNIHALEAEEGAGSPKTVELVLRNRPGTLLPSRAQKLPLPA